MILDLDMNQRDATPLTREPDTLLVEELGAPDFQIGGDGGVVDVVVGIEIAVADGMDGDKRVGLEGRALAWGMRKGQSFTFT